MDISYREKHASLPALIMMVGIPGSGKSTWISKNSVENTVVVSPDDIRRELSGNVSDQTQNAKVWFLVKERTSKALRDGKNVILDATNVASKSRKRFLQGLPPHKLQAKRFEADPEESNRRIRKQIESGEDRADVPHSAILSMHEQFKNQSNPEQLQTQGFELLD
jgi:predicted kinase